MVILVLVFLKVFDIIVKFAAVFSRGEKKKCIEEILRMKIFFLYIFILTYPFCGYFYLLALKKCILLFLEPYGWYIWYVIFALTAVIDRAMVPDLLLPDVHLLQKCHLFALDHQYCYIRIILEILHLFYLGQHICREQDYVRVDEEIAGAVIRCDLFDDFLYCLIFILDVLDSMLFSLRNLNLDYSFFQYFMNCLWNNCWFSWMYFRWWFDHSQDARIILNFIVFRSHVIFHLFVLVVESQFLKIIAG